MKRPAVIWPGFLPLVLLTLAAVISGVTFAAAAAAPTYNGPDFSTSPSNITAGANTNIVLADAQTGTWNYGGGEITNCGTSCSFTLEGCPTGVFTYYLVYQIRVDSPSGAEYALGSGNPGGTYDLTYPQSVGGPSSGGVSTRTTAQGFGPAINISALDVLDVPFGPGTGTPFTLTTSVGTGTYAWFPVTGTNPSASPTSEVGTYNIDIEGRVLCGSNIYEFDIGGLIFTTSPTAAPSVSTALSSSSITQGASVTDTATITGGNNPTGTITFTVYSGSSTTSCTGSGVASQTVTLPTTSATFSGLGTGSYEVQASYSGDSNNLSASSPCGSEPLSVSLPACNISNTIASNFNGNGIILGNYIWFTAHISLNSPSPTNGLTISFTGQTITLTYDNPGPVTQTISVPNGEIIFSSSATYATTVYGASGWVTTEPVTQHADDQIFISGLMYKVPSPGLPGGIQSVVWGGTFSTNAPALNLQWQWGAAVYHYTGTFTADSSTTTGYNSLSVKPGHQGAFETVSQTTPTTNGDQSGTPESAAWQAAVVGGARGGGGSNYTGSWTSTGQANCGQPVNPSTLQVNPTSVVPGTQVQLQGNNFAASTTYSYCISSSSSSTSSCLSGTTGSFTTQNNGNLPGGIQFNVPTSLSFGTTYYVLVYQGSTVAGSASFTTPTPTMNINQSSGAPGQNIQFQGNNFAASTTYGFCLSSSSSSTSSCVASTKGTFTTQNNGNLPGGVQFSVPNIAPGTYYALIYSGATVVGFVTLTLT